jgi:hypothetical protein
MRRNTTEGGTMFGIKLFAATVLGWLMAVGAAAVLTCGLGLPEQLATPVAVAGGLAVLFAALAPALDKADEEFE